MKKVISRNDLGYKIFATFYTIFNGCLLKASGTFQHTLLRDFGFLSVVSTTVLEVQKTFQFVLSTYSSFCRLKFPF